MKTTIKLVLALVLVIGFALASLAGDGDPPGEIGDIVYVESDQYLNKVHRPGHAEIYIGKYLDDIPRVIGAVGEIGTPTTAFRNRSLSDFMAAGWSDEFNEQLDYMGAKTTNEEPTPSQRIMICAYVLSKYDLPISYFNRFDVIFNPTGDKQNPTSADLAAAGYGSASEYFDDTQLWLYDQYNSFSCVGLCERAYENVGLNPTPLWSYFVNPFYVKDQWNSPNLKWAVKRPPTVVNTSFETTRDTDIKIFFAPENIDSGTLAGGITIFGSSSGQHGGTVSYTGISYELTIDPSTDFTYGEIVTVTLSTAIKDMAGNALDGDNDGEEGPNYTFSFTIQDEPTAPPTSITVNANASDTSIEPYDTITISGTATYNNGSGVDGTATINTGSGTYTTPVVNGSIVSRSVTGPGSSGNISVSVSDGSLSNTDYINISVSGDGGTGSYNLETYMIRDVVEESDGSITYWSKDAFRTTDDDVFLLAIIDNADLSSDLDFKFKYYYPDGSQYGDSIIYDNAFDKDWSWGWWYAGFSIDGYSMAYNPGKYKAKFYIDGDRKASHYYVVGWDFVNHYTCDSNNDENPVPSGGKTTFLTSDSQVMALHHFEKRAQGMEVKTEFYAPDGHKEVDSVHTFADDLGSHEWWDDSWHWQTMSLAGTSREYMCGDWTVKFYVKNPVTGSWEPQYTDYFRIQENVDPNVSISASPATPIETQSITLSMSASDNNHLKKVTVHWYDGSWHETSWDNINASSWSKVYSIGSGIPAGQTVEYWCETWDESGNRSESAHKSFVVQYETVSVPQIPNGPEFVYEGQAAAFVASGSTSSLGNPVEYQFEWGDGQTSAWTSASSIHSYSTAGIYSVVTRARSSVHHTRLSGWSVPFTIAISSFQEWADGYGLSGIETDDFDLDGFVDKDEFIAGTDPTNADSYFSAWMHYSDLGGGIPVTEMIIYWPYSSNRFYNVFWSDYLPAGFQNIGLNLEDDYMAHEINPDAPCGFYKVLVDLEPQTTNNNFVTGINIPELTVDYTTYAPTASIPLTCWAYFSDGTSNIVSADVWAENSTNAWIEGSTLKATVQSNGCDVVISGSYEGFEDRQSVTVQDGLISILISGESSVLEYDSATYSCVGSTATGDSVPITPTWSVYSGNASIDSDGVLTTYEVWIDQSITVRAVVYSPLLQKNLTNDISVEILDSDPGPPPPSGDDYEPDDYYDEAKPLLPGEWQDHTLTAMDIDWIAVDCWGYNGQLYFFFNLGGWLEVTIYDLYNPYVPLEVHGIGSPDPIPLPGPGSYLISITGTAAEGYSVDFYDP